MTFNSFEELIATPFDVMTLVAKSRLMRKYYKIDADLIISSRTEATQINCGIVSNTLSDADLMIFYSRCLKLIPENKTVQAVELHYYLFSKLTSVLFPEEWGQDLNDSIFEAIKTKNLKVLETYLPVSDEAQVLFTSLDTQLIAVNTWLSKYASYQSPIKNVQTPVEPKYSRIDLLIIEEALELVSLQLSKKIGKPVKVVLA